MQQAKTPLQQAKLASRGRALASSRRAAVLARAAATPAKTTGPYKVALLFDCDGVIVDTENLHRRAYNESFKAFDLKVNGTPVEWTVEYYDILANTVGGGKPKMMYHFGKVGWPSSKGGPPPAAEAAQKALVDQLQDRKTEAYKRIVEEAAEARSGVLALMEDALSNPDVAVAICSAATKEGFIKVVDAVVGPARLARFDLVLAGDDVPKKKPDPLIYNLASQRLGVPHDRCLVVEDSLVGLRAAQGANMACIITPTSSSHDVDFIAEGATAVLPEGLAGPDYKVMVKDLFDLGAKPGPKVSIRGKGVKIGSGTAPANFKAGAVAAPTKA